jgi:PDZ domain
MTHFLGRTLAGALVGASALAMSAQAQTVTNPLQKPAPANERSGQGDRGAGKDALSPQQQQGSKQNEREAKNGGSGTQSGNQSGQRNGNGSPQQSGQSQNGGTNSQSGASQQSNANQQNSNKQGGNNQQGNQQNGRDNRDANRKSSTAREHTAMRPTDMRGPDIGLWFNRGNRDGLVISDVSGHGPIAQLGFREGDRIVSVNGQRVSGEREFITYLLTGNEDRVAVVVTRDGREQTIYVEPAQLTDDYTTAQVEPMEQFGVVLDDRYDDRIVIWRVIPRSPAYYAGIRDGDVISTFGDHPYKTRTEFETSIRDIKAGETNLQVRRGEKTRDLSVDVPEFEKGARSEERGARGSDQNARSTDRNDQGNRDQGNQNSNVRGNDQKNNDRQGKQNTPNTGNGAGGGDRRDGR